MFKHKNIGYMMVVVVEIVMTVVLMMVNVQVVLNGENLGGGGVCWKFESFVENLGSFAPPTPHRKKVNFRHWWC